MSGGVRAKIPSDSINAEHEAGRCPHTAQLVYLPSALDFDHPKVQQILGKADIIVFQRNTLTPDVWNAMSYWRALGKIVTVDLDDGYSLLPPSNPAHAYWILNKINMLLPPVDALAEGLRHADALTAPSKVLLKDWEGIVPGFYIPNWPRRLWYSQCNPKPINERDIVFGYEQKDDQINFTGRFREGTEGQIVLGWGGSISHVDSWIYSGAMEALETVFEKFPNVYLKFCGHEGRLDTWLNKFGDRILRQTGVKPEHWPFVVSTFDIGLAPLDMRPVPSNLVEGQPKWEGGEYSYDERRSWLKAVEYVTAGVPFVATRSATYEGLARFGAMVENASEDSTTRRDNWIRVLSDAITNVVSRKRLAEERKRYALKKFTMEANVGTLIETYERIGNMKRTAGKQVALPNVFWNRPQPQPQPQPQPIAQGVTA